MAGIGQHFRKAAAVERGPKHTSVKGWGERKVGDVFPGSKKIMWVGEYKMFWRMSAGPPGLASKCRICEGEG